MSSREPLSQMSDEVKTTITSRWNRTLAWGAKWLGRQLTAILVGGLSVGGLLWAAFPWGVSATGCLVLLAAILYAVYCRKQLVEERMMRRRAFIDGKRVQQQALRSELSLRQVAIGLAGNPGHRRRLFETRTPGAAEVRQAADYVAARARAHVASVDDSPRAQAARRRGTPSAPKAPNVEPWIRRADVLDAEIRELDAEIQTLSVPDSRELEEALQITKAEKRAAHEADRVARQRLRAGKTPSPAEAEAQLSVAYRPDGSVDTRPTTTPHTPEQIAREARDSRTDPSTS